MEIAVFPASFSITAAKVPQREGAMADAVQLRIVDAESGLAVSAMFGPDDWASFQRHVADPVGESQAAARAKIVAPNGLAPSIRRRQH